MGRTEVYEVLGLVLGDVVDSEGVCGEETCGAPVGYGGFTFEVRLR